MNSNINIDEVKQYNANLKKYRDMSSKLQAEKQFLLNEIENECKALSGELGIEVNSSNIEQVKEDLCNKINSSLQSGNTVLAKIASETQAQTQAQGASAGAGQVYGGVTQIPTQSTMEQAISQQPIAQSTPVNPAPVFSGLDVNGFNGADELDSIL